MTLQVSIVSDRDSWINAYVPTLSDGFQQMGCAVTWCHEVKEIPSGDLVFFLGCGQLVPREVLARNQHNLVVHESALPHGRGWSPLSWQILSGQNRITASLFEAEEKVDSGVIYLQKEMCFEGHELVDELREIQAETSIKLCLEFVRQFPEVVARAVSQQGEATYYSRRRPQDSRLDPDQTVRQQFDLLRIVDNKSYPAFFELSGETYVFTLNKVKKETED